MTTFTRYQGTALFLADNAGSSPQAGYILPAGASTPDSFSLADALNIYSGYFILFAQLPANTSAFVSAAQVYLANPARAGVLVAWFTNPAQYTQGLTAMLLTAPRNSGKPVALTRTGLIEFANLSLNLTIGTVVTPSGDGNSLVFTTGGTANTLVITPMGQKPVSFPFVGNASLSLLTSDASNGCVNFGLSLSSSAAQALDLGLRMFTAPPGGGYTATSLYPVFDIAASGSLSLSACIDPLQPLTEARSFFTFSNGTAIPSHYRTPVGGQLSLTPQSGSTLVFSNRLTAVDAKGNPVILPGRSVLYLIPKGDFALSASMAAPKNNASLAGNLMCGLSAVEYLNTGSTATLSFVTGQNAFAPTLQLPDSKKGLSRIFGALGSAGQTAWAYLSVVGDSTYYAQPDSAVVYQANGGASMLNYLPIATARLPVTPTSNTQEPCFPLLPYVAAQAGTGLSNQDVLQFETQVLSPQRRRLIATLGSPPLALTASAGTTTGTTPQGMLLDLTGTQWSQLALAQSPATPPPYRSQNLLLESVTGDFQAALQSNQLFLVINNGTALLNNGSIPYALTAERLDVLQTVVKLDAAVITALQALKDTSYTNLGNFEQALKNVLSTQQYNDNLTKILNYTGDFSIFVADYEFDLSPYRWGDHNTIVIFKFCNKALNQLASDTSQWSYADEFNVSSVSTQQQVLSIISAAQTSLNNGDTDFDYFVNQVANNPAWNGVLILNAEVPLSGLPAQMEGIAAGIDASQFQAHHLGINITPVNTSSGQIAAQPSSVFGLIDYEDPTDLAGTAVSYQFKVNKLKILISNSEISDFTSTIELMINQLFGEPATQLNTSSNCLKLQGFYQNQGGVGSYSFVTTAPTAYAINSGVLDQLSIQQAQFVTLAMADPDQTLCNTRFFFRGALSFKNQPGFDVFSYGPESDGDGSTALPGLNFSNLAVDMAFDVATPSYKTFAFDAVGITLDAAGSTTRSNSLAAHFPMQLTGLIQGTGNITPDSLGYMPVDSPLAGSAVSAPWFGLQYNLDLGSPGALAAQVGFTAGLLLAWAPNPTGASIYLGLSLPGVSGGQRAISLQGILSLAFGDVRFLVSAPSYMLELRNIALKFLSLTFPPNGQTSFLLFGNPSAQTSGALGWYASYVKNSGGQSGGKSKSLTRQ